jgi:hypothetical protein
LAIFSKVGDFAASDSGGISQACVADLKNVCKWRDRGGWMSPKYLCFEAFGDGSARCEMNVK